MSGIFFAKNPKERRLLFSGGRFSVEREGRDRRGGLSFLLAAGDTHTKVDPT